jgi:hypothetical protein
MKAIQKAKTYARLFVKDDRGQSAASGAVEIIVALTVAALVAAFLIPVAISELVAVETTNWSSGAASLWDIMDLIVVLAIFLFMIGLAVERSGA